MTKYVVINAVRKNPQKSQHFFTIFLAGDAPRPPIIYGLRPTMSLCHVFVGTSWWKFNHDMYNQSVVMYRGTYISIKICNFSEFPRVNSHWHTKTYPQEMAYISPTWKKIKQMIISVIVLQVQMTTKPYCHLASIIHINCHTETLQCHLVGTDSTTT